jgi:hypothetical protein
MAYTHTTFAQLKTALANRLGDVSGVYWVNGVNGAITDELGQYIIEALRTWGLFTGYWRDTGTFNTVASTALYNINTLTNGALDPLLSSTVTDKTISAVVQHHLLEPATGSTWTGSEQFTLADVTGAMTRRRDLLLAETGTTVTRATQVLAAGSKTFDVPDTTLLIRRLAWTDVNGVTWPVLPDDIGNQRNYGFDFMQTPATPATYSSASVQPLRYVIAPPPNVVGTLDMLLVQSGTALTAAGIALGVPDDMSWVVKWGTLADLLGREGPGQDLPRSYFCERRWRLGLEAAKLYPTVINVQINGADLSPESIDRLDMYSPNWQSTTGTPDMVGSYRNYLALATAPNGVYSVLLDVVRKAIIPAVDADFIQIGREYLDPILDYAEHLAAFKCAGYEFRNTYRGAANFFNAALGYNQRLAAQSPTIKELIQQSTLDDSILGLQRRTDNQLLEGAAQASDTQ